MSGAAPQLSFLAFGPGRKAGFAWIPITCVKLAGN